MTHVGVAAISLTSSVALTSFSLGPFICKMG